MFDESENGAETPNEKVEYIERMSHELGRLATIAGFPFLSYLLDMVTEEAIHCKADGRLALRSKDGTPSDANGVASHRR